MWVSSGRPHLIEARQSDVDDRPQGLRVADGCHASDGESGGCSDVVGVGLGNRGSGQHRGQSGCVHPVSARCDHQHRLAVGEEDQRTRDLPHLDTERPGGLDGGAGAVIEPTYLAADAPLGERGSHRDDGLLLGGLGHERQASHPARGRSSKILVAGCSRQAARDRPPVTDGAPGATVLLWHGFS